jgi:DNA-binding CsgD family transcriptional regulator
LTNRQIAARLYMSPHAVNTHVRDALMKLGIRSLRRARAARR